MKAAWSTSAPDKLLRVLTDRMSGPGISSTTYTALTSHVTPASSRWPPEHRPPTRIEPQLAHRNCTANPVAADCRGTSPSTAQRNGAWLQSAGIRDEVGWSAGMRRHVVAIHLHRTPISWRPPVDRSPETTHPGPGAGADPRRSRPDAQACRRVCGEAGTCDQAAAQCAAVLHRARRHASGRQDHSTEEPRSAATEL